MREVIKILGKLKPGAASEGTIYTVPSGARAVVNIHVFNAGSGASDVKVATKDGSGATASSDYIWDGRSLAADDYEKIKGVTLDEFNQIRVESDTGDVNFNVFGVEVLPEKT